MRDEPLRVYEEVVTLEKCGGHAGRWHVVVSGAFPLSSRHAIAGPGSTGKRTKECDACQYSAKFIGREQKPPHLDIEQEVLVFKSPLSWENPSTSPMKDKGPVECGVPVC